MENATTKPRKNRENERGAALVMALLISFLLLVASTGLLLESSMNTANMTDATAEQQAYNAAESGIQSAVNVLRGNVVVSDANRIDPSKPATDKLNKIDYVKASSAVSNLTSPACNLTPNNPECTPRLSRWLRYEPGTYADRVKLTEPGSTYVAANGYAYSLSVFDPDQTGSAVTYWTRGILSNCDRVDPLDPDSQCADLPYPHRTYGTPSTGNFMRITYIPTIINNQDLSTSGSQNVDFGKFKVEINGTGAQINGFNRFEVAVTMTHPHRSQRVMRGWIETNTVPYTTPPRIIFDSQTYTLQGSLMSLGFASWASQPSVTCSSGATSWTLPNMVNCPNDSPQRVGYEARLQTSLVSGTYYVGTNVLAGTMTPPEPVRLAIQSTGYGPRGASKKLEAIIQKNFFNGLTAPATLTLVGAPCPILQTCFAPGSSNVTTYSGDDVVSTDIIPPIGTTDSTNLDAVQASVDRQPPHPFNGTVVGVPSNVTNEIPDWLSSPQQMDTTIHQLANTAESSPDPGGNSRGRFFPSGTTPTTFGDNATGVGITFCDGNCTFTGNGGGILVVTGKLTLHGNFNFKGLIIVTGADGIVRSGGGTGILEGNIVVAPYANSRIEDGANPVANAAFLPPRYNLSGGGNSTIQYNSSSVANGLSAVSNFVLGVAEK
ncbi:MAG: pilus assembly PilX N-terminal domain-containing protein [Acidobacteriota bacterium]